MFFFQYFPTSPLQGRKFLLESRKLENVTAFVNIFLKRILGNSKSNGGISHEIFF